MDKQITLLKAEKLINEENYSEAKELLENCLVEYGKDIDLLNDLAVVNLYTQKYDEAFFNFLSISSISPDDEIMLSNFKFLREQFNPDEFNDFVIGVLQRKYIDTTNVSKSETIKRVSIVQTPRWNINQPALAVAVLTGNLRSKNFDVFPFDFDIDFYNTVSEEDKKYWSDENEQFWTKENEVLELLNKYYLFQYLCIVKILENNPQVVGFSIQSKSRFLGLLFAEKIRMIKPDIYLVLGGPETSNDPQKILNQNQFIDALFIGEADVSFPQFLSTVNLEKKECESTRGVIFRNSRGELIDGGNTLTLPKEKDIPMADFSDFDFNKYRVPNSINLIMSRGCVNKCSFCNESPVFKQFRFYKARRVYDEILNIMSNSNMHDNPRICFNDSLINGNLKVLEELCDLLIENPIKGLTFSGMMLVRKQMSESLIEKLAKAGLVEVFLGVETGSEHVLSVMQKNFELPDVERIVRQMHFYGIRVAIFFMVGHPGESELDFYDSLNFMRRLANNADQFSVNITQILENSDINSHPDKYNVTDTNAMFWVSDNGTNTYEVRKQRQLIARTLLGDKAYGMGHFEDPQDEESKRYYSQGRKVYEENMNYKNEIEQFKELFGRLQNSIRMVKNASANEKLI